MEHFEVFFIDNKSRPLFKGSENDLPLVLSELGVWPLALSWCWWHQMTVEELKNILALSLAHAPFDMSSACLDEQIGKFTVLFILAM